MRKWSLTALGAALVIAFVYFRALASVEELGELAPAAATELESHSGIGSEPALPTPRLESGRTPLVPSVEVAQIEPELAGPAAAIRGIVRDPHGQPQRAYLRYVWNDRGRAREANVWSSREGRFELELPQADAVGDLLAYVYRHAWSPAAQTGVAAGATDLELTLGPPAFFEVEFRAPDGSTLPAPWTRYYWELAGNRMQDYPGPTGSDSLRWAVSPVPFWISAQPRGARSGWFGPFDPQEIGTRLVLEVERLPTVRGRVVHAGVGVAGAWVELEPLGEAYGEARGVAFSPRGPSTRTDAEGRFEILVSARGRHGPVAFHDTHGSGRAPAVELDGAQGLENLEIELDTAPGALLATVILPQGRSPTDIWLSVSGGSGFRSSRADGTFSLPGLEPGIHRISVADSDSDLGEDRWIQMTHGPGPPDWLPQEFTFEAEVRPGETRAIELDLGRPPACRLQGVLSLGTLFLGDQDELDWAAGRASTRLTPRLVLDHGDPWEHEAAVSLDHEGRFLVGVPVPGPHRIFVELTFPQLELHWELTDEVELLVGTHEWKVALERGSLRLLPPDPEHPIWSGPVLDWRGPGNRKIRILYPLVEDADGSVLYRHVPAGTVTFSLERAGETRAYSCEIRAGETTELRLAQ